MFRLAQNHFYHHGRVYSAAAIGALFYLFLGSWQPDQRFVVAGDAFFAVYLLFAAFVIARISAADLCERAALEDEGIFLVIVIVLTVIAFSCIAIVTVLNHRHESAAFMALSIAGAPLGWFSLHTIAGFHYANLYYAPREKPGAAVTKRGLDFPSTAEPGVWEFLYFAFVVGMTAQTSDVEVIDTRTRRAVLGHSVVSFFFNTAIIAMAVNTIIVIAS